MEKEERGGTLLWGNCIRPLTQKGIMKCTKPDMPSDTVIICGGLAGFQTDDT